MRKLLASLGLVGLVALIGLAQAQTPAVPDEVARLYRARCLSCHGADGRGQTTAGRRMGAVDWTASTLQERLSDADLARAIREGVRDPSGTERMQANRNLTPQQVDALVRYVRSFRQ